MATENVRKIQLIKNINNMGIPREYLTSTFLRRRVMVCELHSEDLEPFYVPMIGGKLFEVKGANYGTNNIGFKTKEEARKAGKEFMQRLFEYSKNKKSKQK